MNKQFSFYFCLYTLYTKNKKETFLYTKRQTGTRTEKYYLILPPVNIREYQMCVLSWPRQAFMILLLVLLLLFFTFGLDAADFGFAAFFGLATFGFAAGFFFATRFAAGDLAAAGFFAFDAAGFFAGAAAAGVAAAGAAAAAGVGVFALVSDFATDLAFGLA